MLRHVLLILFLLSSAQGVRGQEVTSADEFAVTSHEIDVGGRSLRYSAHAGLLPIRNADTGDLMARIFITAYRVEPQAGEGPRPLTFIWNGGPGASSSQTHLVGFGPMGLETPATYPEWSATPPTRIGKRSETWLATSDLVFVDPVGTGYSRATSEDYLDLFYSTRGDIEAAAELIRLYRTRFDAWDQPLFIGGESYGTTRAMGVAEALERRRAGLAGVILVSGYYDAGQEVPAPLQTALQVPMMTAAAHFHGQLPPDLQSLPQAHAVTAAENWARREYAPALSQQQKLTAAGRSRIIDGLARYTALSPQFIDAESLTVPSGAFADRLLDKQNLELGRYDFRMVFPRRDLSSGWGPTRDPSLVPMLDLMQGTFPPMIRYFRDVLGYRSDLLYRGPFGEGFHPRPLEDVTEGAFGEYGGVYTDWMTLRWDRGSRTTAEEVEEEGRTTARMPKPPLRRAMEMNPDLLVWNIKGMYDGSCPALREAVARTPDDLRPRVRTTCYAAGHMVYTDIVVRHQLARDFEAFVEDALAQRRR